MPRKPLIAFRLDDAMYETIKKAASNDKVSVGEFARRIVLRELGFFTRIDDPIAENIDLLQELREQLDKHYDKMNIIETWCNRVYRSNIYNRGVILGLFPDEKSSEEAQQGTYKSLDKAVEFSLIKKI